MIVQAIAPHLKNEAWRVIKADDKEFICFNASLADALKVGEPLPEGTEEAPPKFEGALPSLKLPFAKKRDGGGGFGAAYRNTKEGFDREQVSIHRSVALQYAVELSTATEVPWLTLADEMFAWLESSGTPPSSVTVPAPRSPSAGDWGEKVEAPEPIPPASASPPPSSPPSSREGVGGSAAGEVGPIEPVGSGAVPASLAKLVLIYGSKAKVMRAAKIFYRDDPTLLGIENLSEAQALELVEAAHRPVPDA